MNTEGFPKDSITPDYLSAVETEEADESILMHTRSAGARAFEDWDDWPSFQSLIQGLNLRYFQPAELLVKGAQNASGGCAGTNTNPPRNLWSNRGET